MQYEGIYPIVGLSIFFEIFMHCRPNFELSTITPMFKD